MITLKIQIIYRTMEEQLLVSYPKEFYRLSLHAIHNAHYTDDSGQTQLDR